ncbi:hypothetical protein GWK47_032969 [Chionoecetes opilio]|uniref:Uncharacterized protein n=1 Tax=Chionoecetes opilio TaxID=41210 RepID=A0A8J5D1D2_CHIOP|nr:hypothetical protein GWK47_032969 [Chionoecetes opilio]
MKGQGSILRTFNGHNIQQWKKFFSVFLNKGKFIKFRFEKMEKPQHREKLEGKSCMSHVSSLLQDHQKSRGKRVELKSSQEETDTRLLFHAPLCSEIWGQICINCRGYRRMVRVWACATRSPPVPEVRGEKPRAKFRVHHTEPNGGQTCVIHLLVCSLYRL